MQTDQGLIYLPQNIEYVLPKPKLVESVPSFFFWINSPESLHWIVY